MYRYVIATTDVCHFGDQSNILISLASKNKTALKPEHKISLFDNEKDFEDLFKVYYDPLTGFAQKYVNDWVIAEEVVQETFSNLWAKSNSIDIRTNIKSYLYGAVRNACLNILKHQKVIHAHHEHVKNNESLYDDDFLELQELEEKIDQALDQLPNKCREIFELSRFKEKKYREIADELSISVKTVETQMSKALKVMREALGPYLPTLIGLMLNVYKIL